MAIFFYRIFLSIYVLAAKLISPWQPKAKLWLQGRKNWRKKLESEWAIVNEQLTIDAKPPFTIWMHCASLGEFEQGRPVLEMLRLKNPNHKIVLSFFSPSGYEVQKNYAGANMVCYLPMDSEANAKDFLDIIKPCLALWVKYEYWYYFLQAINSRNIPLLLVSGVFRPDQPFFKWHGQLPRKMLTFFTHFFVQNQTSYDLTLPLVGKEKITITGDTRFDRVIDIAEKATSIPEIEKWLGGAEKVFVAGSTWPDDEEELTHYVKLHPEIKFIIAPHHIDAENITDSMKLFPMAEKWTSLVRPQTLDGHNKTSSKDPSSIPQHLPHTIQHAASTENVLLIDAIGLLAKIYRYADITYLGGGFGNDGVHNVLEAAVYGKPVIHGPEYEKYAEATGLVACGGAYEVDDALELEKILDQLFANKTFYNNAANAAKKFVYEHKGATKMVIDYIEKL